MQNAGLDIDSYCGKCRLELAHVIVAARDGRAVRVQCKTCMSTHNHRDPKKARATAPKSAAKAKSPGGAKTSRMQRGGQAAFEEAVRGHDLARALRYRPSVQLSPDAVVDHPKFGLGIVTRILADNKASVLFADSERTLVHSRA